MEHAWVTKRRLRALIVSIEKVLATMGPAPVAFSEIGDTLSIPFANTDGKWALKVVFLGPPEGEEKSEKD